MRKIISLILISATLPLMQGCVPAALVGGTASIGSTLAEERKIGEVLSDTEITATVNAKWLDHDPKISEMVGLQVRQGRVLLTGLVDTPLRQIDAVRLAWEARGVKEVIDETKVGETTVGLYAADTWITTKLKTEMLFNEDISSINYNVKTVDGVVYLLGIAQNQQELDRVMQMARKIEGVKNIINYMRLKDGSAAQGGDAFPINNTTMVTEEAPIMVQPVSNDNYNSGGFPAPRAM
jgi:osmotically-inducible protein OsmY